MKIEKYIRIITFLLCSGVFAQQPPVLSTTSLANPNDDFKISEKGNYAVDANNERDQYVGTWEYYQNGILFQLKIEKLDQAITKIEYQGVISTYSYCDEIILRYKLVKDGTTLHDNLDQGTIDYVTSWGIKQSSRDAVFGRILDYTRNVVGTHSIKKLSGTPQKILFNLVLGAYTRKNDPSYYQDGQPLFSIPTGEIEMVKVN